MLYLTQRQYSGSEILFGEFNNLKEIYNYLSSAYGRYSLENKFSHDPMEYTIESKFSPKYMFSYDERVFCFVATNHKGI
jgi:hypothetical protein